MSDRPSQMSQDVARAVNLLAHPLGSMAAASAMGLGVATQAWGLWFGAVAGAMAAKPGSAGAASETIAAVKARAAAVSLMADAQSLTREMTVTAPKKVAAAKPSRPVGKSAPVALSVKAKAGAAKPTRLEKPAKPDDLKAIGGIGPKLEQVLNGMGVWTYAQIAAWTSKQAADVEEKLGLSGRIGRDDWIGQAGKLAGK